MIPAEMVKGLLAHGFSQAQLAKLADTTQATISRIANGTDPRFSTGQKLEQLYLEHCANRRRDDQLRSHSNPIGS